MAVAVEGEADLGVAEHVHDHPRRHTLGQEQVWQHDQLWLFRAAMLAARRVDEALRPQSEETSWQGLTEEDRQKMSPWLPHG